MIVRDRQGREYRLQVNGDGDSYFIAKLLYRNSEVGRLECVLSPPDKLVIGDILIRDDVIHVSEQLGAALLRLLVEPKPIDYRRMGLGTHLLQFAIKKARQRGIKRICGSLTEQDINNNPNLVKWYEKHGFEILPPSTENIENAVCGISLNL
ncbi:GNAT family N-acetyltransferase [Microcoleus sp. N9_B2]|uniref:GNAT family N-acetyltransferase n=1 Tax=unclassified Microcoleus TaxID=2642155 RepID=UPI002FD16719